MHWKPKTAIDKQPFKLAIDNQYPNNCVKIREYKRTKSLKKKNVKKKNILLYRRICVIISKSFHERHLFWNDWQKNNSKRLSISHQILKTKRDPRILEIIIIHQWFQFLTRVFSFPYIHLINIYIYVCIELAIEKNLLLRWNWLCLWKHLSF